MCVFCYELWNNVMDAIFYVLVYYYYFKFLLHQLSFAMCNCIGAVKQLKYFIFECNLLQCFMLEVLDHFDWIGARGLAIGSP